MKKVAFIKDHPSGISAGRKHILNDAHADRLADEGYVTIEGEAAKPVAKPVEPKAPKAPKPPKAPKA